MLVEKRQRRSAQRPQIIEFKQADKQPGGSRFNPISEDLVNTMEFFNEVEPFHVEDIALPDCSLMHKDKTRHSFIVISENSDPNLRVPTLVFSTIPASNNTLTLGKPPDPSIIPPAEISSVVVRDERMSYVPNMKSQFDT
ncbi:hypothetical protein V6N12_068578 [Hibiscus sabdariffa]|uniref:Uncharacterized protein n=1 Tax=Hibiscus sabdariffa TaxID=183260 RepID=A0ABR2FQF0_9ROSI